MAVRYTQGGIETLLEPTPAIRGTQFGIEVLIGPVGTSVLATQFGMEALILPAQSGFCGDGWTIPTPATFPFPAAGGPQYIRFQEMESDWRTFREKFLDGTEHWGTLLAGKVRIFQVDYDGLDEAQAAILDAHWVSTRGKLDFALLNPQTAESLTGVRYVEYRRPPHVKKWSQQRFVTLVKFPV